MLLGALTGAVLSPFSGSLALMLTDGSTGNFVNVVRSPIYFLSATSAFAFFGIALLLFALPIWLFLHWLGWTRYAVAIMFGIVLTAGLPALYSILAGEKGTDFIFASPSIIAITLSRGLLGAIVAHVIWRTAYRPTRA